ncbi:T-lymphocyte activation antigen CD80 [Sander vitreus]
MRIFLGVLLVVIVSGDEETMLTTMLGDSVLLPCPCSERNLEFHWQMEEPNMTLVFKNNNTTSNFYPKYKGRAQIFLYENRDNCSVLFINVTADDQGKYRCSFHRQEEYQRLFVYLNVSAGYTVCQTANNLSGSVKVFQCHVKGRYRKTEIQWILNGELLPKSKTTNITHTYTLDAPTGLYHFNSTLRTELNGTVEPTCHVKAKGISTIITHECVQRNEPHKKDPENARYRYLTIIPIMLLLGLSLLLWRRWDSQSSQRIREVGADNLYC